SGYHEIFPLTEKEIELLFHLVYMRLCVSVTNSARERKREPDNEYLTISEKPAWELLEKLAVIDPAFAHYIFRDACKLDPCPSTAAVVDWLKINKEQPCPIIEPNLKKPDGIIFDFSVGSPETGDLTKLANSQLFSQKLL